MRFFSWFFYLVGAFSLIYSLLLLGQRYNPSRIAFSQYEARNKSFIPKEHPTRLRIKNAKIDIPIILAPHPDKTWTVSENGASYLSSSPLPGSEGNSILYGHNWSSLLGNLNKAKPGDIVEISFDNSQTLSFKITAVGVVTPDQTHVLKNTKDARITIYTCTGFFDTKRLVVTATFIGSSSIHQSKADLSSL